MLKKFTLSLIRLAKKAAAGVAAWLVSLFVILIIGTIFQLPDHGSTISTLYSLTVVFIPIIVGVVFFIKTSRPSHAPTSYHSREFLSSHTEIREIRTKVAGVSFNNENGSSRQELLSLCEAGQAIELIPFRYKGDPAYRVITQYGQIGNLRADDAALLDDIYRGCVIVGTISKVTGGANGQYYGCNIILKIYQKNL